MTTSPAKLRPGVVDRLLNYGVPSVLADKAAAAGLTTTKIRVLAKRDLRDKYGLTDVETAELKKCVVREPIDTQLADLLLGRSNHLCCVCRGAHSGVVLHHIEEYEKSQDNSYANLAVLCPNHHDLAHRAAGLTLGLTADQIRKARTSWERLVEVSNAQNAARSLKVSDEAIDYVNVMRIEEMCVQRFGSVPPTTISPYLTRLGILGPGRRFDEAFVRKRLSGGNYLFDYINSSETEHYRQLLKKLSETIEFEDLSEAARSGIRRLKALEGRYAFFIGGVTSKRPKWPIKGSTPFAWRHRTTKVDIRWDADANYLMSSSSISRQGSTNRYILYGLVRTVQALKGKPTEVTCSPLLVAQPAAYVDRTPNIAWRGYGGGDEDEEEF